MAFNRIIDNPYSRTALLLIATLLAYFPSFGVRFFLDDFRIILENPLLHDLLDIGAIWRFSEARFLGSLTFAANYSLHGDSVFGFHLVNFLIHLIAGLALFWFVRGLMTAPALAGRDPGVARWLPWIAVAIFLLHPLQTQAVTYIVQRYTSLMAMFYLLSMAAYTWARLRSSMPLYGMTVACLVLAALSKQSSATLPLALLLIELMFFRRLSGRAWSATLGIAAVTGVIGTALLTLSMFDITGLTRETDQIGRVDYLATQMEVLWRYIGLFFLVGDQRLEYDIAVASGFSEPATLAMALGHCALIAIAAVLWRRSPMVAFGILFHYLAHLVESSVLPIIDVAFEHRTYLPNAGLALAAGFGLARLIARPPGSWPGRLPSAILVLSLIGLLAGLTFTRNSLWADRLEFLQHETRLTPNSQRAWTSLGKELMREARFESALVALRKAGEIAERLEGGAVRPPTLLNTIFALHYSGRHRQAIELADNTPVERFNRIEKAFFYEARGRAHHALGENRKARQDLLDSVRLNPTANAVSYLAAAEFALGNRARARDLARQVLASAPDNPLAQEILRRER